MKRDYNMTEASPVNENERLVHEFYTLWEKSDVSLLLPYFSPDSSYIDMPLPPRHGIDAINDYISGVFAAFTCEIETKVIASRGDLVLTERIDHLRMHETGAYCPLPIMGIVRIRDGRILEWRDYLDIVTAETALGIGMRPSD